MGNGFQIGKVTQFGGVCLHIKTVHVRSHGSHGIDNQFIVSNYCIGHRLCLDNTVRKGSIPDVVGRSKGPLWSPRLERKRQEDARKGKKKEEKRKTLAELALEAGYTVRCRNLFIIFF